MLANICLFLYYLTHFFETCGHKED